MKNDSKVPEGKIVCDCGSEDRWETYANGLMQCKACDGMADLIEIMEHYMIEMDDIVASGVTVH